MSYVRTSGSPQWLTHRASATLNQAAPVQNTWYTVLPPTSNVRVIAANMRIETAVEDLEFRITVDGVVIGGAQGAAVIATEYRAILTTNTSNHGLTFVTTADSAFLGLRAFMLEGRQVSAEVRKTSNTGAGNLKADVVYATRS